MRKFKYVIIIIESIPFLLTLSILWFLLFLVALMDVMRLEMIWMFSSCCQTYLYDQQILLCGGGNAVHLLIFFFNFSILIAANYRLYCGDMVYKYGLGIRRLNKGGKLKY